MKNLAYEILQSKYYGEIGLETTNKCNLKCSYCYNDSSVSNNEFLDLSLINRIIDEAQNITPVPTISFSGGEFFLYESWEDVLKKISLTDIPFNIVTNGTLLSDEVIFKLSKYTPRLLQISLDGVTDDENILRGSNVSKIIQSIKNIGNYSELINVTVIRMTVSKTNCNTLTDSILLFNSLGCYVRMGYLFSMGRGIDNPYILETTDIYKLHTMLYKLKNNSSLKFDMPVLAIYAPCNLIEANVPLNVRINANGEVFACFGVESCGFDLGNIYSNSLSQILKSDKLQKAIVFMLDRHQIMRENGCSKCVAKDICKGGCLGHSLYENENEYEPPARLCKAASIFSRGLLINNYQEEIANVK